MGETKIVWAERTWSPVLGCTKVSSGCARCYAVRSIWRLAHHPDMRVMSDHEGLVMHRVVGNGRELAWTGKVRCLHNRLTQPRHWTKPKRVFVCPMGDLFHEQVSDEFLVEVFATMFAANQHRYLLLTKRPERMREFMTKLPELFPLLSNMTAPIGHIWFGVSVENQRTADERIPILMATPVVHRWVSAEPLLGSLDLNEYLTPHEYTDQTPGVLRRVSVPALEWCVAGCESGKDARLDVYWWYTNLIEQCDQARVPLFIKQASFNGRLEHMPEIDAQAWDEYPPELVLK